MDKEYNKIRLHQINSMLMELANGNFGYRIARSERNDELEALVVLVNMMAEEMKDTLMSLPHGTDTPRPIAQMTLVVDDDGLVRSYNPRVLEVLHYPAHDLLGLPLSRFLDGPSQHVWEEARRQMRSNAYFNKSVTLHFKTEHAFRWAAHCSITLLAHSPDHHKYMLVTVLETVSPNELRERNIQVQIAQRTPTNPLTHRPVVKLHRDDVQRIQEVNEYILQHLDEPLPSLKTLAHFFGTNDFKLKYGFKRQYGTTVFRFLTAERLKRASLLVRNTEIPLKRIAALSGFKSYPHFSKAFRKRFGYAPLQLRKGHIPNGE